MFKLRPKPAMVLVSSVILAVFTSALAILPEDAMPEISLVNLQGQSVKLSSLKGKPVVLNFWASWCPPCKAEMPELSQIFDQYKSQGVEVVGVNLDEGIGVAKTYLAAHPVSYPIWADAPFGPDGKAQEGFDRTGKLFHELNPSGAIPFTVFVRRDGTVEDTLVGFDPDIGKGKIERRIKLIMASQ